MPELEIRPTMRFIKLGYVVVALLLAALLIWWSTQRDDLSLAAVIVSAALFLWPASRHLKRQRICCRLEGGQLRCQSGLLTTTVKTIQVSKIQDVTVHRTMGQRMFGIGDLRIETAGQSSAFEITNVDDPEKCADQIQASIGKK